MGRNVGTGALVVVLLAACGQSERPLRLGATYTLEQSGALALLDSATPPVPVAVVVGPSGQILRSAASGDLDVVVTHAPALEARFLVAPALAALSCPFVASRFVVVGPAADPAEARTATSAADALAAIARAGGPFVSRGDSSGTHERELALWHARNIDPRGQSWYLEAGADQVTALRLADERDAYALADLPTLARLRDLGLRPVFGGDTALVNGYTLYVVRAPTPHPGTDAFATWALTRWRERLAGLRSRDGTAAFEALSGACRRCPQC